MVRFQWSDRFELNDATVNSNVAEKPGIYRLLTKGEKSGKYKVRYVGIAENLKKRMIEHLSDEEQNDCIKKRVTRNVLLWFRFAYSSSKEDRQNAEYTMYHHFGRPECNYNEPLGNKIDMNFE